MMLSKYFSLSEMTATSKAARNDPSVHQLEHLKRTCYELDKLRERVGPIRVTSGFRSPAVNALVNGSSTSRHMRGDAADVIAVNMARPQVWSIILHMASGGWPVDQAILYEHAPHIHIGFTCGVPRGQLLVCTGPGQYPSWDSYKGPLK